MTDKDKQELDALRIQIQCLQVDAHQRDHQLMMLQQHATRQDRHLARLLTLLGLLPTDLDAPGALTAKATLLLRLARPAN